MFHLLRIRSLSVFSESATISLQTKMLSIEIIIAPVVRYLEPRAQTRSGAIFRNLRIEDVERVEIMNTGPHLYSDPPKRRLFFVHSDAERCSMVYQSLE